MSMLDTELFPVDNPLGDLFVGAQESFFALDNPISEEVSTEVDETGDIVEKEKSTVPINTPSKTNTQFIAAKCPMVIMTKTTPEGSLKKVIHAYIRGPIEDLCGYIPLIDTLNRADAHTDILIHIQSGGGMVTTGSTIASAIKASQATVTTIAEGLCASAASLIWSAGDDCVVTDYAMFMYHMSSHADMNNSVQVANNAIMMVNYVKYCLMKNALAKGHITPDQHRIFCENKDDVWISAKQMREQIASIQGVHV